MQPLRKMMRLFVLVLCLLAATNASSNSALSRILEEDSSSANLDYFTLQPGVCFRVKVAQDNDDDGNSYFYNGAYRAQFERYASFFLCQGEDCSNPQEYVSDLDSYIEAMSYFVQNYCQACSNQCRRRLEDEAEQEQNDIYADCSSCSESCSLLKNNNYGNDETAYLGCQWSHQDGDIDYYVGPACYSGQFAIGYFYDDECSIKAKRSDELSEYLTFQTIQENEFSCSSAPCADLLGYAVSCQGNEYGGDEYKLCKAASEARKERSFYKKPWYKKIELPGILFLVLLFGGVFVFLSYTYYIRHKQDHKTPLAALDGSNLPEIA